MAIKDFLKGTIRVATSIFLALLGLAAVIAIYLHVKESQTREEARAFEVVKDWTFDPKDSFGVGVHARTKLVAGRLLASLEVTGHSKYLADPRNREGSLIFEFLDKDGFRVVTHSVKISEFTTIVGKNGEPIGLKYQYDEYLEIERYRQLSQMQVGWRMVRKSDLLEFSGLRSFAGSR